METTLSTLPTECTIEQLIYAPLDQLLALTDEQWEERLRPILASQETIFAELPKKGAAPSAFVAKPSRMGPSRGPQAKTISRDMSSVDTMIKQGLTPQQITLNLLVSKGVQLTPELMQQMREGKKV